MMIHVPQQQISAWLDGQLEPAKAAEVEAHLRQCRTCSGFKEEIACTTGMFRNLEPVELPPYLWTRVAAELEQPRRRHIFAWLRWQQPWFFRRREFMGVAAVALVMLGTVVAVFEHRASVRTEMAVIAQLDSIHNTLAARNPDIYNPFHVTAFANADANPFSRQRLEPDTNPFRSLGEKR